MTTVDMEFEVVTPGCLEILSVGKGDIKLTIDPDNPDDIAKAKAMIDEMLAKGYTIMVEAKNGRLSRVKKFNPKRFTYVISEVVENPAPGKPRTEDREVPVGGAKAKAIGRTAGG